MIPMQPCSFTTRKSLKNPNKKNEEKTDMPLSGRGGSVIIGNRRGQSLQTRVGFNDSKIGKQLAPISDRAKDKNAESQGFDRKHSVMTPTSDDHEAHHHKFKCIPDDMRYEFKQRMYHQVADFEKQLNRDFALMKSPFPADSRFSPPNAHEKRFDLPDINIEIRSQNRNTKNVPTLANYSKRKELFKPLDLPDSQIYSRVDQVDNKDTKSRLQQFQKISDRRGHFIPSPVNHLTYDHDIVTKAINSLSSTKRVKCYVSLKNQK